MIRYGADGSSVSVKLIVVSVVALPRLVRVESSGRGAASLDLQVPVAENAVGDVDVPVERKKEPVDGAHRLKTCELCKNRGEERGCRDHRTDTPGRGGGPGWYVRRMSRSLQLLSQHVFLVSTSVFQIERSTAGFARSQRKESLQCLRWQPQLRPAAGRRHNQCAVSPLAAYAAGYRALWARRHGNCPSRHRASDSCRRWERPGNSKRSWRLVLPLGRRPISSKDLPFPRTSTCLLRHQRAPTLRIR